MNSKIRYNKYDLKIDSKHYRILVPDMEKLEAWAAPGCWFHDDITYIDGNREFFRALKDIAISLTIWPDVIIYLPINNIPPLHHFPSGYEQGKMDVIFYNHQIQFKRSKWVELRNIMGHLKPQKATLKYNLNYLNNICKNISRSYHNRKSSWLKKADSKVYYEHYETIFVEGSRCLYAEDLEKLSNFLRRDLEGEALKHNFSYVWALGIESFYLTSQLFQEWESRRKENDNS